MNSTTAEPPTPPPPSCIDGFNSISFTHYTTIPAVVIILILAFLERRKQKTGTCNGRPALIVPLHLLDGYENRFAYAVAFGAVTNDIINLFMESLDTYQFDYPLWAVALMLQVQALEVTVTCFPIFACIATRHKLVGSVCGFLYNTLLCAGVVTKTVQEYCAIPDDVRTFRAVAIMRSLPVVLCYLYLMIKSAVSIGNVLISKIYTLQENTDTVRPHQTQHVRLLLRGYYNKLILKDDSLWEKITYSSISGFKYPVKIVSVVFITIVVLYQLVAIEFFAGAQLTILVHDMSEDSFDNEVTLFNVTIVFLTPGVVHGFLAVYYTSVILSTIMATIHVYFFIKAYRKHILRLYRGDRAFMMEDMPTAKYLMASSLRFPGYQIAYSLWGTVIMLMFLLFFGCVVCYAFFFMDANGYLLSFLSKVAQLLSFPATTLLLFYIQVVLARYVLLQPRIHLSDKEPPINVNNRRFYEDFNFFTLFGSLAIGIFSCLLRILYGTVMGVAMVGRLDKTTFMRDTETFDKGHLCYMSMLQVHNAHNHPVLRVFSGILWDRALEQRENRASLLRHSKPQRRYRTFPSVETPTDESTSAPSYTHPLCRHSLRQTSVFSNTRMLRKWHLVYTLLRNPALKKHRKHALTPEFEIIEKTCNSIHVNERELETVRNWHRNSSKERDASIQIS